MPKQLKADLVKSFQTISQLILRTMTHHIPKVYVENHESIKKFAISQEILPHDNVKLYRRVLDQVRTLLLVFH